MTSTIGDKLTVQLFGVLHSKRVQGMLTRVPLVRGVYRGWLRRHPFDREYGIDTSGFVAVEDLQPDSATGRLMQCYGASQPGIVRRVFETLPDKEAHTLVDLGCGKGRVLFVASEFGFKEIIGIDISRIVLDTARRNAEIVQRRFPGRTPVTLVQGNAVQFMPSSDRVVFFLYHPFSREGVEQFVAALEQKIAGGVGNVFVVYYNPVWSDVLDGSPRLARWSASTLPYDPSELGFGPDVTDTVAIWQSLPRRYNSHPGAERPIVVTTPSSRANLVESAACS